MRNFLVILAAIVVCISVVVAVFVSSRPPAKPTDNAAPTTGGTTAATGAEQPGAVKPAAVSTADNKADATASTAPASTVAAPSAKPASAVKPVYHAKSYSEARVAVIGSNDKESGYNLQVELSAWGASILDATTTHYVSEAIGGHAYPVQRYFEHRTVTGSHFVMPMAATAIVIDGQSVDLAAVKWELKSQTPFRLTLAPTTQPAGEKTAPVGQAVYGTTILGADQKPVLEITRTWTVKRESYQIQLKQEVKNLTGEKFDIQWQQRGMGDTPPDTAYLGERRLDVVGFFDVGYNPTRQIVYTTRDSIYRTAAVDEFYKHGTALWPQARSYAKTPEKAEMVWLAYRNRYFTAALYRPVDETAQPSATTPLRRLDEFFPEVKLEVVGEYLPTQPYNDHSSVFLKLGTPTLVLEPNSSLNLDLAVYAGPLDPKVFSAPPYKQLGFSDMIIYSLGGICGFCTFQWLAHLLLSFLHLMHYLTGDWGVAIILLVLVVRLALHPITKKSQINMTKMGKQMAQIQPEIDKLKKKYENDQATLNAELLRLYRERNINPLNMLGCLPMFLQMPIWIALYAMLYFAIELRHEPAFWGFFQAISGGKWHFFADLSSPDRMIVFFDQPHIINLYLITFDYSSINVMPVLMGVMFLINQKLMAPPALNETARQQQKMMMWITVLFPFMLYSAPSGLTLYIFASTAAGIIDSLIVKRHIAREEAAGTLFKKDPSKGPGFLERVQKMVEAQQARMEEAERQKSKNNRDK